MRTTLLISSIVFAGFGFLALNDYDIEIAKAEAKACGTPDCQ